MPEYLAPGVYVEETSFRSKSIEGVGTSTTAFVGPTRKGPVGGSPELLTSVGDFERIYGGPDNLTLSSPLNYLAHAVRHFFDNGGARLYVSRVFVPSSNSDSGRAATAYLLGDANAADSVRIVARTPGSTGNGRVGISLVSSPVTFRTMGTARAGTLLRVGGKSQTPKFYRKAGSQSADPWNQVDAPNSALDTSALKAADVPGGDADFLTITVSAVDADGLSSLFEEMGLDRNHPSYVGTVLSPTPARRIDDLENTFALEIRGDVTALQLHDALLGSGTAQSYVLTGGNDGGEPNMAAYQPAIDVLSGLEDVSIVAAPGCTAYADFQAIQGALIAHVEKPRAYRIAVLDTKSALEPTQARDARGLIDSTRAALYYPWVVVSNPLARPGRDDIPREITVPPSGFVCGVYARTDIQRGVFKAPANEVVLGGVLRFEKEVNFAQQGLLNPIGVNCLRTLTGRGMRVWGARTASSDPEWKYVPVRRYFLYLESSIDQGTQWAVFEPNGPRLWSNVRETITSFLYNEWTTGALLGESPKEAFFVRCDRSTMTQNDLDNGRLICLIGVAVVKPAEFVIFRIGQMTADARG